MSTRRSDFGRLAQIRVSDTVHKADVTLQKGGPRKAGAVLCAIPAKGQPKKLCETTACRAQQSWAGPAGRQKWKLLWLQGRKSQEQTESGLGGPQATWGMLGTPQKNLASKPAKVADNGK